MLAVEEVVDGVVKRNSNASLGSRNEFGSGMVARDHEGLPLACASDFLGLAPVPVVADALEYRWEIMLTTKLGFHTICFETNCLQLFQRWKKPLMVVLICLLLLAIVLCCVVVLIRCLLALCVVHAILLYIILPGMPPLSPS